MASKIPMPGDRFGRLVVLKEVTPYENNNSKKKRFLCQCDCGRQKVIRIDHLRNSTRSCGCIGVEKLISMNKTHGLTNTRIYRIYKTMIARCYYQKHKSFNDYGGKGIEVCDEWLGENGFINFKDWAYQNGYSDELTIDRIDNLKGYSPENCRWATRKEQAINRRTTRMLTYNDKSMSLTDWATFLNMDKSLLHKELKGKTLEEVIIKKGVVV